MKSVRFSTFFAIAGLFVLSLVTSCRHSSPTETSIEADTNHCCHGMVTVTALDTLGDPIHGAGVTLSGNGITRHETTGEHGTSTMVNLCDGIYEIHVSKDGYTTAFGLDTLTCNDTSSMTFTLHAAHHDDTSCSTGSITLTVNDSATHDALSGGTASLYLNGHLISSKEMSVHGTTWTGLHPGRYSFSVSKDGYNHFEFSMDSISCDQSRSVDHNMSAVHHDCCSGVAELTVTDSSTHHALSGATVVLYKSGTIISTVTTNGDGGVRFANLCEGNYRITIDHDGYAEGVIEFGEDCNATHGLSRALLAYHHTCDTASITVRLQDSTHHDTYIQGATVTVRIDGSNDIIETGTTSDGGYFTATHLVSPNHYILTFSKDGYNEKSVSMTIDDCRNYHETYQLSHH